MSELEAIAADIRNAAAEMAFEATVLAEAKLVGRDPEAIADRLIARFGERVLAAAVGEDDADFLRAHVAAAAREVLAGLKGKPDA